MYAATGSGNPVIFAVISVLVVALVLSPTVTSYVFAVPANSKMGTGKCTFTTYPNKARLTETCCWRDNPATTVYSPATYTCQTCDVNKEGKHVNCTQPEIQFLTGTFETQPTFPSGPVNPPGDVGVLEETEPSTGGGTFEAQQIPPSNTTNPPAGGGGTFEAQQAPVTPGGPAAPKIAGGFNTQPPPPIDEGTQAPSLTEEPAPPICPEGQVLDEQTNLCVLEEPDVSEEEPDQSEPGEQEQTEEGDGSEDGNNDNN